MTNGMFVVMALAVWLIAAVVVEMWERAAQKRRNRTRREPQVLRAIRRQRKKEVRNV